jgi:hypothetical protein
MRTSLNYLAAQERTGDLLRAADAARLAHEATAEGGPASRRRSVASAVQALWLRVTRTRASADREPEAHRAHA